MITKVLVTPALVVALVLYVLAGAAKRIARPIVVAGIVKITPVTVVLLATVEEVI